MHEFTMHGAIGYLYAEQELNEICKIYEYGTWANTSKTFHYQTGDVVEGLETGTITGSGARSITIEDINQITKYNPSIYTFEEFGTIYKYGQEDTYSMYYPTKTTESGASTSKTERTYKFTGYMYQGSEYLVDTESPIYKILFENNKDSMYWLASRGVYTSSYWEVMGASFDVFCVANSHVVSGSLCRGGSRSMLYKGLKERDDFAESVRPIVYLKSNIQTSRKDASGAWIISE